MVNFSSITNFWVEKSNYGSNFRQLDGIVYSLSYHKSLLRQTTN